ncbi:hypothetical protein CAL65_10220 [Alkalilimnicola ehrlichii]|uniref:Uncharacterized protein n=1 Tax=Alkalilimnicola ehrlichii TaxID=351052 RepID=A0A3E0WXI9_9GAMM|nr:hypothetical protein CAL65_10220 [Alkalilimnicola ehrlichii]
MTMRGFVLAGLLAMVSVGGEVSAEEVATGCDCGSTDAAAPCTGNALYVRVDATRRGSHSDAVFEWEFNANGGLAYCGQFANGDYWIAPGRRGKCRNYGYTR